MQDTRDTDAINANNPEVVKLADGNHLLELFNGISAIPDATTRACYMKQYYRDMFITPYTAFQKPTTLDVFNTQYYSDIMDCVPYTPTKDWIHEYVTNNINKFFGLNLYDYFELTLTEKELLNTVASEELVKLKNMSDTVKKEIENELGEKG